MCISPFSACASSNEDALGDEEVWPLAQDLERDYQGTDCGTSPSCSPAKSVKEQGAKVHFLMFSSAQGSYALDRVIGSEGQRLEALERLKLELEDQSTEGCTPDQSTEGCTDSPPYSPIGSPTPSLDVMISTVIPTVRPSMSPKSTMSSPFLATLSPRSIEENVMMELMLDMIYRAKHAKKKGMRTRTLTLDDEETEGMGSECGSEKTNVSRTAKLRATMKEMLRRLPASVSRRNSAKSYQSNKSSAKHSLASLLSKRLRSAKKQE